MLTIGCVDNVSALAFRICEKELDARSVYASPAEICKAAGRGAYDAALLSAVKLPSLADQYEPLPTYGIAGHGRVRSVLVLSASPLRDLIANGLSIYLSPDSETSRALFVALCVRDYGTLPVITSDREQAHAMLLIGDEALKPPIRTRCWPIRIDLGEWWQQRFQLPFVFAQWAVRRNLAIDDKTRIRNWLEKTVAFAESPTGRACRATEMVTRGVESGLALAYVGGIYHRLGPAERLGMWTFGVLRQETAAWPAIA